MTKFMHADDNDDAKAEAIHQVFSENSQEKKLDRTHSIHNFV